MTNHSWRDRASTSLLTRSCSLNLDLLIVKCYPFQLSQEFTAVRVCSVYIPPHADSNTVPCELHEVLTQHQALHWEVVFIVMGDFNIATLSALFRTSKSTPPAPLETQRYWTTVTIHLRTVIDLSLPTFRKWEHLGPGCHFPYSCLQTKAKTGSTGQVGNQSVAALQDTLEDADCDMIWRSSHNIYMLTEAVGKIADDRVEKTVIRTFPKPSTIF